MREWVNLPEELAKIRVTKISLPPPFYLAKGLPPPATCCFCEAGQPSGKLIMIPDGGKWQLIFDRRKA